ncbi:MAG: hypothetical protein Fur0041_14540 [Bacteroidia bacterium]
MFVDPRRPQFTDGDVLLTWVKKWFDDYGFVGIKMYPALGYYPFDEKLDELYAWCEATQIPITYHCSQGVIHYRGNLDGLKPPRFTHQYHRFDEKEHKRYQANFTDPENFAFLLEKYKRLKICLAHFGGEEEITKTGERKGRWYEGVKQLMRSYENVYTDISFSLHNTATFPVIAEDLKTPVIGERILFGTDYFVVEKDKDESYLRDELKNYLQMNVTHHGKTVNAFDQMAAVNPLKYLTSAYYSV